MEAIVIAIAQYSVTPAKQWLGYSFHYSSNIENMKNREEKLRRARDSVQHSIDAAIRNGEEIEADVKMWLTEVDKITELARQVLESEEEAKMKCSFGACLSLKLRHQLSQKAKKIVQDIGEVLENGRFDKISYRPASQGIVTTRYMDHCMEFVSRMSTVKGLKEALGDGNINVIGIWGMPGVGKTTLVREVARQVKEDKLFDEVAMAEVTQSQDLGRIQGEIADMLDLKLDAETVRGRAIRLRERLTKEKKILVILDDIWEKLDLEAIGIPSKGCKVVMVSRQHDLLSCEMGTQKDFGLEILPKEEAWSLFEKMAGDSVKDPNLRFTATEVAKECGGLPIALVTVSKALKNKSIYEWKDALQQLRRPAPEYLTRMQSTIYSSIELSYRHLESQEVQHFFLHCAEMGFCIGYSDLLKYCYGLGLFPGIKTLEEARNRLYRLFRNLKDSCLLQDCPHKSDLCHMHDVVRDVATLIAVKDYNMLVMRDDDGFKEWPDVDSLKRCKAFSIRGGDIHQLPNKLECPELRFFYVCGGDHSFQIPGTSFEGMEKLKVLDLTKMQLSSLPSSLLHLRNLQTLCLDQCVLGDISTIGELKNLVILSLAQSEISQLPREIGWLTRLRLLDLSDCSKLEVIPPNVLSSLVELEELYMGNGFVQWEAEGLNERKNASLAELKHLSHLTTLDIQIPDAGNLPKDLLFEKLERYIIFVGDVWDWTDNGETSRTLKLKLKTSFQLELGIKMLLNRTEYLYLDELKGVKSVLHELDREGFQQLKHLHIQNNDEIKYIISSQMHMSVIAFPSLETFLLNNMFSLEEICHGQLHFTSFRNLRVVKVEHCEKLKFVFSSSVARGLSQLQELQIRECSTMGAIVVKEEGEIEDRDIIFFPQLRCLALQKLPKLMSFLSTKNSFITDAGEIIPEGKLDSYMPILHEQVVFPNLESLELSSVDLEETQHNQHRPRLSCGLTNMEAMSRFQNLSNLEVQGSCNIKYLLSFSTARFMVHLKHLHISECKVMEEVLVTEELAAVEEITKVLFPRLECLRLTDLPILKRFCIGCSIQFPSLENLWIDHCPKLMTFIFNPATSGATNAEGRPLTVIQPLFNEEVAFPCLERLAICHMDCLKVIWQNQIAENSFCKLQIVKVEFCENLVSIFQSDILTKFKSVETLTVTDCSSLQEVFELQGVNVNENQGVVAIQLKDLWLARLPQMKHVWSKDPKSIFSFENLKQIRAHGCGSLRSFFPASVARGVMQLEQLQIIDCGVEEIVAGEEGGEAITRFVFPQVTLLNLTRLPRLKWFYPGVHTLEWPMLKEMWVEGCHKIEMFASELLSSQETLQQSQLEISLKHPLFLVDVVAFPSLENLIISHMDNLITIWHNQVVVDSFCNIQELVVEFCENLLHVFQSNMPRRFQRLRALRISDCASLEEIFEAQEQNGKEAGGATATHLREMYLMRLPRLKNVWNKDWQDFCSFQNLQKICAEECESLRSFFPASVATSLTELKNLQIISCGVEEIIAREEGAEAAPKFVFPRMTLLNLKGLAKLKWFYPGVHTSKWPLLKYMWVDGCQEVQTFASEFISFQESLKQTQRMISSTDQPLFLVEEVTFPSLETLIISHMDDMKIIWHNQSTADSFCKLLMMRVESCANLISIFQFKMLKVFQSLELLNITGCGSLKQVFDLEGPSFRETGAVTSTQLKQLYLSDLPKLNHIWNKDPQSIFSFRNLHDVRAAGCESMKSLFPASVARTLTELEYLEIINCGVEVIVENEEAATTLFFPKLTSLTLAALPKLKWFSSGTHTLEWPLLKELKMWGFAQVKIFGSRFSSLQETGQQCQLETSIQHPLFVVDKGTFPNLEVLKSDLNHTTWFNQFLAECFCKLKVLEVICNHDASAVSRSNLLKRLQNLEKLVVSCNDWQEIFPYEEFIGREKHARILPQLKELTLSKARMLTYLWKEDTQPCLIFHKLEILVVSECDKLKTLVPSSVCFQNLTNLEILNCHGVINLVTYSTAKSLVQLKKMSVSSCKGITEVVARDDGEAKVGITFSKLTYLKLDCLPSFSNFCSGSHSIVFPSLEEVIVSHCPEMKTFCHGVLSTPKLERVKTTKEDESHWQHDLNATIHWLWERKLV